MRIFVSPHVEDDLVVIGEGRKYNFFISVGTWIIKYSLQLRDVAHLLPAVEPLPPDERVGRDATVAPKVEDRVGTFPGAMYFNVPYFVHIGNDSKKLRKGKGLPSNKILFDMV